ncbi:MAG: sulfatase-like hydrolase/transferase [Defluviitaleaceae bacterium]|nr:sulfatase-like hydrolase/transferase [Defluviitaleaceae bacterium]
MKKKPNVIFLGVDSLRRDHMSLYGYHRLTTPHLSKFFEDGIVFEQCLAPSIPTPPGYSSMITGMDLFNTNVVALRHQGGLPEGTQTLASILSDEGYNTTSVGMDAHWGNAGFQKFLHFSGWGSWDEGRSHKAEALNEVALPELERLAGEDKPFLLFLRHMDPHAPYLPPAPYERMFYQGDEYDKNNKSLEPIYNFKPFCDFFYTWFPPFCTDSEYIIAQYDGAVAYMDACIQAIFQKMEQLGIADDTIVAITSDHGETLYDHECYFDHHGLYDPTLRIPFAIKYRGGLQGGLRIGELCSHADILPTLLDVLGIKKDICFDGRNMMNFVRHEPFESRTEYYLTEATWMHKHGWRTPEWKLIVALEPDFHYKPEVELYNLVLDPQENFNVADRRPDIVEKLKAKMHTHIAKREKETGRTNPSYTNVNWCGRDKPFETSDEAYNHLHIGDPEAARRLQAKAEAAGKE